MYDPLISTNAAQQALPSTFWSGTTEPLPESPRLQGHLQTDVIVIGGGFTGLLTAYYLATEYGRQVTLLEANRIGFGASARNGGFVLKGSGRLGYGQMAKRWDLDTAKGIYQEFSEAVARVEGLIQDGKIDCNPQEKGYLKIAHSPKAMKTLQAGADFIARHMGQGAEFICPARLRIDYLNHHQSYGALRLADGFGLNPLKLLQGYARLAREAGVQIFEQSTVLASVRTAKGFSLETEAGRIDANAMVFAGNAYTQPGLTETLTGRFLPILSNVIVTEPLSEAVLAEAGLYSRQVAMDTRILKYYYRLLPENRLLFGGRGAVWGRDADNSVYPARLKEAMNKAFPALTDVGLSHTWHGWLAASLDDMPHVYTRGGEGYSLGYCGAGVSFSSQAAWRLAGMLSGKAAPSLPLYGTPLPAFPLAPLRRVGQWAFYHYGRFIDAWS
ncbi:FAD-binding oxidoreductase [Shewanella amazonensis]|uniref:FAD dependent oxidoreductase n=1 Tax=Shewanella amazonensis (strain ATCC BAA-1098 / SB2B) TaxID=326297 RepID=A1S8F6_SHEAM|nr:FAD-dependent oxidoreductase [Shewanella amazonensis]ABM00663.1 FAD dependent oxidoreductase [Shewanella amazonensis SB2B]